MTTQIFLITPAIADATALLPGLRAVLAAAPVSAVLIDVRADDDKELARLAKDSVAAVQESGAAALIPPPQDLRTVARLGADGVHALGLAAMGEAVEALKPKAIVGVGGLKTRHEAMEAGEKDIDYVMFGAPRPDGSLPDPAVTVERAQWWAEIFTLPCVAYVPGLEEAAVLVATGAEFIALGPWLFETADPAQTMRQAFALCAAARGPIA